MIVCIGTEGSILPREVSKPLLRLLWEIVSLHSKLLDRDGHTLADLEKLTDDIIQMLSHFKELFEDVSDSNCRFTKFHLTLHLTYIIHEFGSLRTVDTTFGEGANRFVKQLYRHTNRKRRNLTQHMFVASTRREALGNEARRQGMIHFVEW